MTSDRILWTMVIVISAIILITIALRLLGLLGSSVKKGSGLVRFFKHFNERYDEIKANWPKIFKRFPSLKDDKAFLYGLYGVLYIIANAVAYRAYFDGWYTLIHFLFWEQVALGMAVVGGFVFGALIGPARDVPWRKYIAVLVGATIVFNLVSWYALHYGWNASNLMTYPTAHKQELVNIAIMLGAFALVIALIVSKAGRTAIIVVAAILAVIFIGSKIYAGVSKGLIDYKYRELRPGPESAENPEDTKRINHTVTSDSLEKISFDDVSAQYGKRIRIVKLPGYTLRVFHCKDQPTTKDGVSFKDFGPKREGLIRLDREFDQDPCASYWLIVMEGNVSTTVQAVHLGY